MKFVPMLLAGAFAMTTGHLWAASGVEDSTERLQLSSETLQAMINTPDKGIPEEFLNNADASASAGPVGRHASAGTDWKMETEILTYSRSKGAFAGITLNGAVVEQDKDSTLAIYGSERSFHAIRSGEVPAPESTLSFLKSISQAAHTSAAAEAK